jgi:hypothetical protein
MSETSATEVRPACFEDGSQPDWEKLPATIRPSCRYRLDELATFALRGTAPGLGAREIEH